MRKINRIVLHHTATDADYADNINVIREWHLDRGFNDIGYHFLVGRHTLDIGRAIGHIGAHCRGYNTDSIGIAVHGLETFTEFQFKRLAKLLNMLFVIFDLEKKDVFLHKQLGSTECPNFTREDAFRYL